ncbi:DUF4407 domain-containing protein [Xylanibacter brevis]|uniref:DUF4407 domain-containing protein n=1 Tax=Xylanibacter brevis TaxID=83231 RepID=UPI000486EBE5|nr:DUF4407 domain-containing protein [Xylanibacter brevis]
MEEKKSIIETEFVEKSNWYNEFLWWCAGANKKILRQCPTEYAKYAGMGGTIFSTACMAALSGGYAISTVFENTIISFLFGLFWGFVIIFNLDRLIVNTMYSDGKETISWKEFFSGLPRIIMAIFLGIVISTPLELKIYEKSIDAEIEKLKDQDLKLLIAEDEAKLSDKEVKRDEVFNRPLTDIEGEKMEDVYSGVTAKKKALNTKRQQIISQINTIKIQRNSVSQIDNPNQYQNLTSKINKLSVQRNSLSREIDELDRQGSDASNVREDVIKRNRERRDKELAILDKEIEELNNRINNAREVNKIKLSNKYDGFQGRMSAYSSLKEDDSTWWAAIFISMLFIIIECAPTFMRMMVADGSYDKILEAEKHKFAVLADKRISDLNDNINTEVQISTEKNRQRLEAEVLANKELMERLAKTQAELLQTAIEKWREEELAKINENPSAYIQITNRS